MNINISIKKKELSKKEYDELLFSAIIDEIAEYCDKHAIFDKDEIKKIVMCFYGTKTKFFFNVDKVADDIHKSVNMYTRWENLDI